MPIIDGRYYSVFILTGFRVLNTHLMNRNDIDFSPLLEKYSNKKIIESESLLKIKQLMNSGDSSNVYMAWHMLKNLKDYERGEFRDYFIKMFNIKESANKFSFDMQLPDNRSISGYLFKYTHEDRDVFSYDLWIGTRYKKSKIPVQFYHGQKKALFSKCMTYLEGLLSTNQL